MDASDRRIYRCQVCQTIVEVLEDCGLGIVCCGRPMVPQKLHTSGSGADAHLPVVCNRGRTTAVSVGARWHPMDADHCIQWVEIVCGGRSWRQYLRPGQPPQAVFTGVGDEAVLVRAYCSRHGLWQSPGIKPAAVLSFKAPRAARTGNRRCTSFRDETS